MLTRRRFLVRGLLAGLAALLAACASAVESIAPSRAPSSAKPSPSHPAAPTPSPSPNGPSLREAIGQMLLIGFRGASVAEAEPVVRDIAQRGIGGILLFSRDQLTGADRNVRSPEQLGELIRGLGDAAPSVALMVAIDQEGGQVARLGPDHGFDATASAAEMGRGTPAETREVARTMALTLRSVGVTLNLAPVVDVAVNPDNPIIAGVERSFSSDPAAVIAHAAGFIEGHHEAGIGCAVKHFPGQGSASGDTHLGIVDVTEAWTDRELEPFAGLADAGLPDAVLTAHVFNAALDPEHPATLSRPTVTGILRDRLGYRGVVISDDLQMGAIRDAYGYPEALALAIEAGVDVLLIANQLVYEPDIASRTIDIVERLVREGRIGEERIRQSYERILALKA